VQSHKADTHALEESDRAIVSMNQTNKEEQASAEPGEKMARAKENIVSFHTRPTQRGEIECARNGAVYEEQPSSSLIQGESRMRESRSYGSGAAKLAAIPMGESPIDRGGPEAVVVISSNEEGDRIMESLGVKAPVAGRIPGQIRQRG